jgi:drug/metabolite transporter (DMT)-like permease
MLLGVAFLGETIDSGVIAGLAFVLSGAYIISNPRSAGGDPTPRGNRSSGVFMAGFTSLFWALAMILLAPGTKGLDPVMVTSIRVLALALVFFGVVAVRRTWPRLWALTAREWIILAVGGLIGWGLGSIFFVMTIDMLGATRTAIITSTSPLFALPLSAVFLKEQINRAVLVGTVFTVAGVILVS